MSMYPDQTFSAEPQPGPPARQKSWLPSCLAGCLVVGLLGLLVCSGLAWYVAKNIKPIASNVARQAIVSTIEQSELDPAEKRAIIAEVDRVVDQYRTGKITLQDLGRVLEELAKSPVMQNIFVYAVEKQYVEPSGLADEEKQAAHLTLQRVLRGIYEQKLKEGDLDPALDHLSTKRQDGQRQMKDKVTDEELRKFLAECQRVADQTGVPTEPLEVKISEEFRKAIDRAMASPHKPAAPASGESPASGDVLEKPATPASEAAPQPRSLEPGTLPLERDDATAKFSAIQT